MLRKFSSRLLASGRSSLTSATFATSADVHLPYRDRITGLLARIDKDMVRKREQEVGWEDASDAAFLPAVQNSSCRHWRGLDRITGSSMEGRRPPRIGTFDHQHNAFADPNHPRYRKRVGRNGRVLFDRMGSTHCSDVHMPERWRYDSDLTSELPLSVTRSTIDDFQLRFSTRRLLSVHPSDWELLNPNTQHVEEAMRWLLREPDEMPPVQVIGKLPGQRMSLSNTATAFALPSTLPGLGTSQLPNASPAGVRVNAPMNAQTAHAMIQAAQLRRQSNAQSQGNGTSTAPPQQPAIRRLMLETNSGIST